MKRGNSQHESSRYQSSFRIGNNRREKTAEIQKGFLILLGVHKNDTEKEAQRIADRICGLRVFEDAARPEISLPLYDLVVSECRSKGFPVQTGEFGADMKVEKMAKGLVSSFKR